MTIKYAYPIPRIDESLSKLDGAKFFTTLDLGSVHLRLVQRHGHFSKTDGSGFGQSDEEVRESCDGLRG